MDADSLVSVTGTSWFGSQFWDGFWPELIAGIVGALLVLLWRSIKKGGALSYTILKDSIQIPRALRSYRQHLENSTLFLSHSWKLEGQTFERLIVPLHILGADLNERTDFAHWILDTFKDPEAIPRIVLLGEAGSGKSVAMGVAVRTLWSVNATKPRVPLLLSFKEIQSIAKAEPGQEERVFEDIVLVKFQEYQYDRSRSGAALRFVKDNLKTGKIVLILDGLDELEKQVRLKVASFLRRFFTTYPDIPFVISSRVSVWNQFPEILGELKFQKFSLAQFTPLEVKIFVSRWEFPAPKSTDQLSQLIISKPYLLNMAENPLILTIICFLYAQPKRILPDHRVKFYSDCVDALMEKWDNAKNVDRANQFETSDKIAMLNALAYQHLVRNSNRNEEIHRSEALDVIGEVMKKLSWTIGRRQLILEEIIQKSELLIDLKPDHLKFPHRTFLEYFAANYFYKAHRHLELLELYERDPGKWQETLLLFCGMNKNLEVTKAIFKKLIKYYSKRNRNDVTVFKALVETTFVSPKIANKVISLAEKHLTDEIHPEIVESLGYIAINSNWEHAEIARNVLMGLLYMTAPAKGLDFVCIAVLGFANETEINTTLKLLEYYGIVKVVEQLAAINNKKAAILMEGIDEDSLPAVLTGVAQAGEVSLLYGLACNGKKKAVQKETIKVLLKQLKYSWTFEFLDGIDCEVICTPELLKRADLLMSRLDPKRLSKSRKVVKPNSIRNAYVLYLVIADLLIEDARLDDIFKEDITKLADNRALFIINYILLEKGYGFHTVDLLELQVPATLKGMEIIWNSRRKRIGSIATAIISLFYTISSFPAIVMIPLYNNLLKDQRISFTYWILIISFGILPYVIMKFVEKRHRTHIWRILKFIVLLFSPQVGFINGFSELPDFPFIYTRGLKQFLFLFFATILHLGTILLLVGNWSIVAVFAVPTVLVDLGYIFTGQVGNLGRFFPNHKCLIKLQ